MSASRFDVFSRRLATLVVVAAMVWLMAMIWSHGGFVAAGADSYGYVSQADLWYAGALRVSQPIALSLPPELVDESLAPLGYRPAHVVGLPGAIVPTYPPGLPMLMAVPRVAGQGAVFVVVPILAVVAIWGTYRLGCRIDSPMAGMLAALALATSPTFVWHALVPMSDVPVTAWWVLALLGASASGTLTAAGSGLAAAFAILTRPNLVLVALPIVAGHLWHVSAGGGKRDNRLARAAWFVGFAICGALAVAVINQQLYKSALSSGYGSVETLFEWSRLWPNVTRYASWFLAVETPLAWLAPCGIVTLVRSAVGPSNAGVPPADGGCWSARLTTVVATACATMVVVSYLFYLSFDDWTYLRFLLPAYPIVFITGAVAVRRGLDRFGPRSWLAVVLLAAVVVAWQVGQFHQRGIYDIKAGAERYRAVAQYVDAHLPQRAVIFAVQHGGSIRHYSGRLTVRYDMLDPSAFDDAVDGLRARGFTSYVAVESWEEPRFAEQFGGHSRYARLDWPPVQEFAAAVPVRLFALEPDVP